MTETITSLSPDNRILSGHWGHKNRALEVPQFTLALGVKFTCLDFQFSSSGGARMSVRMLYGDHPEKLER